MIALLDHHAGAAPMDRKTLIAAVAAVLIIAAFLWLTLR